MMEFETLFFFELNKRLCYISYSEADDVENKFYFQS